MSSGPASGPLLLLDESLSPNVAAALRLVGYNIVTVPDAFAGKHGVLDPEIIEWCKHNDAVWIYADDRARKQHKKLMLTARIRSLWINRPKGGMSSRDQLRLLSYVLPDLLHRYEESPRILHYRASAHGQPPRTRIQLKVSPL